MNIKEFQDSLGNVTFHNAVKSDQNGDAYLDLAECRLIWMNNLRRLRALKLSKLDVQSLHALEEKDDVALEFVLTKKKELRDMTETYDISQCVDWKLLLNMFPEYIW